MLKSRKLSVREEQILVLVCEGFGYREIAKLSGRSPYTIKGFMTRIREKTGCHKTASLVLWAVRHNVINPWDSNFSSEPRTSRRESVVA